MEGARVAPPAHAGQIRRRFRARTRWGLGRRIWLDPLSVIPLSRALDEPGALFPGDPPFGLERVWTLEAGSSVNVSRIAHSDHAGTHADLPYHLYSELAAWIIPQTHYVGAGYVLEAGQPVGPERIAEIPPEAALLLVRTPRGGPARKPVSDFPTLTPQAAERLLRLRIKTVVVDVLSVDVADSRELPVHRILLEAGIGIVENADLRPLRAGSLVWIEGAYVPVRHPQISALALALRAYERWGWL